MSLKACFSDLDLFLIQTKFFAIYDILKEVIALVLPVPSYFFASNAVEPSAIVGVGRFCVSEALLL